MDASEEDRLPEHEVCAQMSSVFSVSVYLMYYLTLQSRTLVFAATDTTSSAISRILWLLAEHQDVQDKLRQELKIARDSGKVIDYDYLHNLPYLEAVCRETMRVYVLIIRTLIHKR